MDFKSNFKSRFELNHNMDGVHDTTDGDCDGYHKQLDMSACDYDAEVLAGTIPEIADDTTYGVLHCREIDSVVELCFKNNAGTWQITDKGYIATDFNRWDNRTFDSSFLYGRRIRYFNNILLFAGMRSLTSPWYGELYSSTNGISWNLVYSSSGRSFWDICYGNGLYVLTTGIGIIFTSPDLITWTNRGFIYGWDICYGGGVFITAANSRITTSPDGITWTERFSNTQREFYSVCYGDGLYIVVGLYIYTSADYINWVHRFSPAVQLYSVCYGNGLYVTVGVSGYIYTSSDGVTWTLRATLGYNLYSVYYSPYRGGTWIATGASGKIYISHDGSTWTLCASDTTAELWGAVLVDNIKLSGEPYKNMFMIAGNSGVVHSSKKYIEL